MEILVVREPINAETLNALAQAWHRMLVKGAADIRREVVALGGEWHIDANNVLIADGSQQQDIWGFNLYPEKRGDSAIEYISLINIRPMSGNRTMEIADEGIRKAIRKIVSLAAPTLDI